MAFFVIARTSDGSLRLVSSDTFASRQAAMSALSDATRDPAFAHWDADLLVVDLEAAVPVLLVRPTQPENVAEQVDQAVEAEEAVEDTEQAEAVLAAEESPQDESVMEEALEPLARNDLAMEPYVIDDVAIGEAIAEEILADVGFSTVFEAEPETADVELEAIGVELDAIEVEPGLSSVEPAADEVVEIRVDESLPDVGLLPDTDLRVETESDSVELALEEPFAEEPVHEESEPPVAVAEMVVEEAVAEMVVAEAVADAALESDLPAEEVPVADEVFGDLILPSPAVDPEAEPPVSTDARLGLDEPETSVEAPAWMIENPEPIDGSAESAATAQSRIVDMSESEVEAFESELIGGEPEPEPTKFEATMTDVAAWEPTVSETSAEQSEGAVPESWDEVPASEPAEDLGGVVIAWPWDTQRSEDEEPIPVAEELTAEIELVTPPSEPVDSSPDTNAALEDLLVEPTAQDLPTEVEVSSDAPAAAEPTKANSEVGSSRDEIADFIFELENVTDIPEAPATRSKGEATSPDGPTCEECVYDETCPNREQRSPHECGSFQWKIA